MDCFQYIGKEPVNKEALYISYTVLKRLKAVFLTKIGEIESGVRLTEDFNCLTEFIIVTGVIKLNEFAQTCE